MQLLECGENKNEDETLFPQRLRELPFAQQKKKENNRAERPGSKTSLI